MCLQLRRYKSRPLDGNLDAGTGDDEFHSYWVEFQILVPNTYSLMEEHESSQQGPSVFQGMEKTPSDGIRDDLHDPAHDAEEDTVGANGDGGGTVALPPGVARPDGLTDMDRVVLFVPGTDTAITYDPSTGTSSHINEGTPQLTDTTTKETLLDVNKDRLTGKTGQTIDPDTINKVTLVTDVNGDGVEEMVVCTTEGAYLMISNSGTSNSGFDPPVLLSDSADNVKDAVVLDVNGDGLNDIVVVSDGNTPNRVYLGDGTDTALSNLGVDTLGGLRHEVLGGGGTPNTDTTAVVTLDVDQNGVFESFLVTNNDAEDVFYFDGDTTGVKLDSTVGGDAVDTTSVDAAAYDSDHTLVVFGKSSGTGGAKDTYMLVKKTHSAGEALSVRAFDDDWSFSETNQAMRNTHTVRLVINGNDDVQVYLGFDRQDDEHAEVEEGDPVLGVFMQDLGAVTSSDSPRIDQFFSKSIKPGGFAPNADGSESELSQGVRDMTVVTRFDETTPASPDIVFTTDGGSVFVVRAAGSPTTGTTTYDKSSDSNVEVVVLVEKESESNSGIVEHADLDRDRYQDVVTGRHIVLNTGTQKGDFTTVPTKYWKYGPTPLSVTPADVDGDGDVDLVVVPSDTTSPVIQFLLNDGSGDFSNAERVVPLVGTTPIAVSYPTDETTTVVVGHFSGPSNTLDGVLDLAVADKNGITFYISTTTDFKYDVVTNFQSTGAITDILVTSMSGQPPTSNTVGRQEDIVFVSSESVHGIAGSSFATTPVSILLAQVDGETLKMVAVGNVMGDASKAVLMSNDGVTPTTSPTTLTEGTVDSSGVLDDPTQIDARSLDLVFSSDTALYMKQALYDPDASVVMTGLQGADLYTIATYDTGTSGARTVTALEVFDMVCPHSSAHFRSLPITMTRVARLPTVCTVPFGPRLTFPAHADAASRSSSGRQRLRRPGGRLLVLQHLQVRLLYESRFYHRRNDLFHDASRHHMRHRPTRHRLQPLCWPSRPKRVSRRLRRCGCLSDDPHQLRRARDGPVPSFRRRLGGVRWGSRRGRHHQDEDCRL